jgi:hypothetical protein
VWLQPHVILVEHREEGSTMTSLKCPFCFETRPNANRLQLHVDGTHRDRGNRVYRDLAVSSARTVQDVVLPKAEPKPVPCICGIDLVLLDEDREYPLWSHKVPAPRCRNAIPAAGMPTAKDRDDLAERLAENGRALAVAGEQMAGIRSKLDEVDARMAALDAQLTSPPVVRRATLNEVWDRLIDEGCMSGAAIVMGMIRNIGDES